jgi:hypothetical protein
VIRRGLVLVVASLVVACGSSAGGDNAEVEVGGRVLQDDDAAELAWGGWRDRDGRAEDPASADDAPADAASLADGYEAGGQTWTVDGDGWVEVSSRVLDRQLPSLAADVLGVDAEEGAPAHDDAQREVTCRVELQAPADRGLQARGELYVELLVTGPDGQSVRAAHGMVALDLGLRAGEGIVNDGLHGHTVEQVEGTQVVCAVTHEPA